MNDQRTGIAFRARLRRIFEAGAGGMAFDAFISYSHAADGRLAPALQRAIQRLAKPWYRARALRVFRDESALSANPHLWSSIQTAMDDAEWFVLLASPDAAASEWVNRELAHWLSSKSADRILVVLTDGTLAWDGHSLSGTAVPTALRDAFADEPRHVDVRWAASETDLDMHHARFRDVVAQLAAPMHGIAKDDLDSEDVRQHRRAQRLARGGVTALTLLVIVSLVTTGLAILQRRDAVSQRNEARDQRDRADASAAAAISRGLASDADRMIANHQADTALLLGAESYRFAVESHQGVSRARQTLLTALGAEPLVTGYLRGQEELTTLIAFSPDGELIVAASQAGDIRVWDARTRRPLAHQPPPAGSAITTLSINRSHVLASATLGAVRLWDLRTNAPLRWQPAQRFGADGAVLSDDGSLALAKIEDGSSFSLDLWNVETGRHIAGPVLLQGAPIAGTFSPDGHRLAIGVQLASTNQLGVLLVDTASGALLRTLAGQRFGEAGPFANIPNVSYALPFIGFSPDGTDVTTVASGASDGAVATWNVATGQRLVTGSVGRGQQVIGASNDVRQMVVRDATTGTASVIDAQSGEPIVTGLPIPGALDTPTVYAPSQAAAFDPTDHTLAIGTAGPSIALVSRDTRRGIAALARGHALPRFGRNPDWSWVALAPSGDLAVRPNVSDSAPEPYEAGFASFRAVRDSNVQLVDDPFLDNPRFVDTTSGKQLADTFSFAVLDYAFGGDDNLALSTPGGIVIWDARQGRAVRRITGAGSTCANPDVKFTGTATTGHVAMSCGGYVTAWKLDSKVTAPTWQQYYPRVVEGPALASGAFGSVLGIQASRFELRDIASGRLLRTLPLDLGLYGRSFAISADGRAMARANTTGRIDLIDTRTGALQRAVDSEVLTPSEQGVDPAVAFSPDGTLLAGWFPNGAIDLWDPRTATLIAQLEPRTGDRPATSAVLEFNKSGNELSLVTHNANDTSTIRRWNLGPADLIAEACRLAGSSLTRQEWNRFVGNDVTYHQTCDLDASLR